MKKRIISILLCAVMLLCAIPFSVSAEVPDSVVLNGDDLWTTVIGVYGDTLNRGGYKLERVEDKVVYTQLTDSTNVASFKFLVDASYRNQYGFAAIKYKLDLSGVTDSNYQLTKLCFDSNWKAAEDINAQADGQWHIGAGAFTWNAEDNHPYRVQVNIAGNTTGVTDGKYAPAGLSIEVEELALFKTREAMYTYQAAEAPKADTETGFVYSGSRLETVYDYYNDLSRNVTVEKATDGDYAKLTSYLQVNAQSSRFYIPLNSFSTTENSYFVLKYRYNGQASCDNASLKFMRVMNDSTGDPVTTDGISATDIDELPITADGQWHELVIDLKTVLFDGEGSYMGNTWANHEIKGVYIMPWLTPEADCEFDVEVLGFVADQAAADLALGKQPADTTPADTTPADTTPADTTPADTTPADTTPATTTPEDATPENTTTAAANDAGSTGCGSFIGMASVA